MKHLDFILLDIVCLQIAFLLSYFIRNGFTASSFTEVYQRMAVFMILTDIVLISLQETFKNVLKRGFYREFVITVKHVCLVELLAAMYLFVIKESDNYSRIVLVNTGLIYAGLSYIVRIAWKSFLAKRISGNGPIALLVVTNEENAWSVIETIRKYNFNQFHIKGVALIDSDMTGQDINDIPVVASADTVARYVCREWVDEVLIIMSGNMACPQEILSELKKTGVVIHQTIPEIQAMDGRKQVVERMSNYTVVTSSINNASSGELFLKRMIDIIGGLFGCILTGLIAIVVGPMIYIKSPGPIFFSQVRVGRNGKKFKIYKFRSMYMDAEKRKEELMKSNRVKDGMMFKLDFDPRVIGNEILPDGQLKHGLGQFLRESSLDEFPQFLNVLKGDMSIVGTRPPTVDEWEKYRLHHRARMTIKPGITGMWQVSGRSNILDFEEVVKLDTDYISRWSIGLDLRIMLQTFLVLLKKDGAL